MRRPTLSLLAVVLSTACGPQEAGQGAPPDLDALNAELSETDGPIADPSRFAPLCDANGYPLVGNINVKAGNSASAFCAELRAGRK